ncbi:hypothetical protein [Streptomyces sp. NBC_00443]|uniref:hypothetical protein n=1 Tax=Streptomyces sp. NBC_00443 TaxID=2975743 RepID=UPI002E1B8933
MTSPIDELLGRARLLRPPYAQAAIEAAAVRLSALAASFLHPTDPNPADATTGQAPPIPPGQAPPTDERSAADDLQTLCETVITHTDALADLEEFLARALPQPPGARVLGCMLQLCAREESARFWWQYAAGAGDSAASYCLYLHHRALGEPGVADWWQTQHARYARSLRPERDDPHGKATADAANRTEASGPEPEDEISTTLRVLRALKPDCPPVPDPVNAVLHYIPAAIAYVDDDLDLPLPDPDFTDRIRALATPAPVVQDTARHGRAPAPLPSRRRT